MKKNYYQNLIPQSQLLTFLTKKTTTLEKTLQQLELTSYPLLKMQQTHSSNIAFINETQSQTAPKVDAVYTTKKNLILSVKTADCLPLLIYHPYPLIAAIHAGQASTEAQITAKTFQAIQKQFNLQDNFTIWLGPAICKNCYQIDPKSNLHYDLINENKKQLQQVLDLNKSKIIETKLCTSCNNDLFYSYRKEKTAQRIWSGIMIKEKKKC
jgi:polyphenol oxidase